MSTCAFFLFLLSTSSALAADGTAQIARFNAWLNTLRGPMSKATAGEAADALLGGSARTAAFNLQALGRMYESQDFKFRDLRFEFKSLEDYLGSYDKWSTLLTEAEEDGASDKTIKRLTDKRDEARRGLEGFLKSDGWVESPGKSRMEQIDEYLGNFAWLDYDSDRAKMLQELTTQLRDVNSRQYDLTKLEEGNGLHELRREIRWYLIETRVLNGMVLFRQDNNDCPVAEYADLVNQPIASSKYSKLPASNTEIHPCRISRCLFLALVKAVDDLGALKDKAEKENNVNNPGSDDVPPKLQEKAEAILAELQSTQVLELVAQQHDACEAE